MRKLLALSLVFCWSVGIFSQSKQFTISGYISDKGSGEKLMNANVYEAKRLRGAISNVYGFYSLSLPAGEHTLSYSFVGYQTTPITLNLQDDTVVNVGLKVVSALNELTVVGGAYENKLEDTQMSREVLTMKTVQNLPAFMGEADVIKTMQLLPGVQSGTEASTGLYVRGGGPDQNLILLDGVPVYNANHLFGFFSVFNSDAIKSASLYKGGFPARFGGRLSSVVDIRMKEGNEKEFHGGVQVGLIATKFFVEGPIKKDKTAFHFSARRTYIDALARPFMKADEAVAGYYFYDLNAKINHKFSDKSRVYLSAYTGRDKASVKYEDGYRNQDETYRDISDSKLQWGNVTTAARWNYIVNQKLFSNTTLTFSQYKFNVGSKSAYYVNDALEEGFEYNYHSGIEDVSAKTEFDWYANNVNDVKFGATYIHHTFRPGVETINMVEVAEDQQNLHFGGEDIMAHEMNVYFEDDIKFTSRLKANVGLHLSAFSVENSFYTSLEPRASLRYRAADKVSFKASYSKMQQYLHLLSNSGIGLPTDLWLPVTDKIKPQVSQQFALGGVWDPLPTFTFSIEGFYKDMNNLMEYKEGASFFGSSVGWEDKVEMGIGKSYGLEFLLKKDVGKTTGWVGYTWSKAERMFDALNYGEWFPAKYDRRHDVSIVLTHKFSNKFDIGATWVFGTGNAFTLTTHNIASLRPENEGMYYDDGITPYFEQRNNYRMPNYHRLDVGMNFHKKKKNGIRTWNISVYNAYNRSNAFYLYPAANDQGEAILSQVSLFPILPSISYSFKF